MLPFTEFTVRARPLLIRAAPAEILAVDLLVKYFHVEEPARQHAAKQRRCLLVQDAKRCSALACNRAPSALGWRSLLLTRAPRLTCVRVLLVAYSCTWPRPSRKQAALQGERRPYSARMLATVPRRVRHPSPVCSHGLHAWTTCRLGLSRTNGGASGSSN